jgi:hypothetical protein
MILSTLPFILISSNYYYHLYKNKKLKINWLILSFFYF